MRERSLSSLRLLPQQALRAACCCLPDAAAAATAVSRSQQQQQQRCRAAPAPRPGGRAVVLRRGGAAQRGPRRGLLPLLSPLQQHAEGRRGDEGKWPARSLRLQVRGRLYGEPRRWDTVSC